MHSKPEASIRGLISVPAWICISFRMALSSWRMACNVDWQLQVQQFDPTDEFTTGSSPEHERKEWRTPSNSKIINNQKRRKGPWQASEACAVNCEVVPEEHVPSNLDSLNFGVWLRLIIQPSLLSGACCVSGGRACVNGHTQFTVTAGLPTDTPVHLRKQFQKNSLETRSCYCTKN